MFTRSKRQSGDDQDSLPSTSRPALSKPRAKRGSSDKDGGETGQKRRKEKLASESEAVEENPSPSSQPSPPSLSTKSRIRKLSSSDDSEESDKSDDSHESEKTFG